MTSETTQKANLLLVTPIYKEKFDDLEKFSIDYSLNKLEWLPHVFIAPDNLDLSYYQSRYKRSFYRFFPNEFFASHSAYNQLCYEIGFYNSFRAYSHILVLQPDAIVVEPNNLDQWLYSPYDYVGAPENTQYIYAINDISPFDKLQGALKTVHLQGLNGGLSLRKPARMIEMLQEYPELTKVFRTYAGGVGEDIFFSLMSRVSRKEFYMPSDLMASRFAITGNFRQWLDFSEHRIPFGFHGWYKTEEDKQLILEIIGERI
jgi:hypothetical protein